MPEERVEKGPVRPWMSEQLAQLRESVETGTHEGESFELIVTDSDVEEALAWYAEQHPGVPFHEVRIRINPDGVELSGEVRLGTLQTQVTGRADVYMQDGVPLLAIDELSIGKARLPDFIRFQLEDQLNGQLMLRGDELPLIIEEMELQEGQLAVRGTIR